MKEGINIEVYYRYCKLDKIHEYNVVCKERPLQANYSPNGWIFWVWYYMGIAFKDRPERGFRLMPFANTWDEKCKIIKSYKDINGGYERVIVAIKKHFDKVKRSKPPTDNPLT